MHNELTELDLITIQKKAKRIALKIALGFVFFVGIVSFLLIITNPTIPTATAKLFFSIGMLIPIINFSILIYFMTYHYFKDKYIVW